MPKILENVKEQLLAEAERQILEIGYAKTTVRSVAAACGVAVGTVYNYFPSKEMLVATFVAEDWKRVARELDAMTATDPETRLFTLYTALRDFAARHKALFSDADAVKVFSGSVSSRHPMLRQQLSFWILPICTSYPTEERAFVAAFTAEALITWTMAGKPFPEIYAVLKNTLKM